MKNLFESALEKCALMDKVRVEDGYGGFVTQWQEGAKFSAAFSFNSSIEAKTAQKQGVNDVYTISTKKNVILGYHDVIKRLSDGMIFRVTTNGADNKTPDSAALNMRVVSAEAWKLDGQSTGNS